MLKVDKKKEQIEIVGDSDLLKDEIGTLMLALCGEVAKVSKGAAEDMFNHIVKSIACVAAFLETKRGVKLRDLHEAEEKEDEVLKAAFEELQKFFNKKGDK